MTTRWTFTSESVTEGHPDKMCDAISDTINSLTREQGETTGAVDAGNWFSFFRIFGYTVLVGALNVLLITALSTVGSVIYNLAADLVGGVEVTLSERD